MSKSKEAAAIAPDQLTINPIQAERLASLTKLKAKELSGKKHAELAEKLKWTLDPQLFFFRKICGRVVKKDPLTGTLYPVPNATVHVEDTDCGLLGYFPTSSKYAWFYPLFCHRETLATVKTDECGEFCVWIPRWDIDWILRWRKERFCFPFVRPSLFDLFEDLPVAVEKFPPRPGPDPEPFDLARILDRVGRLTQSQLADALGPVLAGRVGALAARAAAGASTAEASALFSETAAGPLPPLPAEFKQIELAGQTESKDAHTMDLVRTTLAHRLGLDEALLKDLDLATAIGPFTRCHTYYVPEWMPIFDVPDITFRVTQDVDGDGDEEVIYSEGFFDVRWNAGTIPSVTLEASGIARESKLCEYPPVVCGTVPDIQFAGMMPVSSPYLNNALGYARRPNRPRPLPPPVILPDATAPFCQNVNLFGCLVKTGGATKYRLVYKYSSDGGVTFSPEVPFTDGDWWWHPTGAPVHATADANGWYDLPPAGVTGPETNFLFPFNTAAHADGLYEIRLQMGTGGSSVTSSSSPVRLRTDNSYPQYTPSILWRIGSGPWNPLSFPCPLVTRGVVPQSVEFDVRWDVSAAHYRNASISAGDCGSGSFGAPVIQGDSTASGGTDDWHQGPLDNAVVFHARYVLPAGAAQGTYNFGLNANTRAFSPAGADANYQALDWSYDSPSGGLWVSPAFYFSVINA